MASAFEAIFPPSSAAFTTPTPLATPDLGFIAPGQSFGGGGVAYQGSSSSQQSQQSVPDLTPAQQTIRQHLAWSTATGFLSTQLRDEHGSSSTKGKGKSKDVHEALGFLLVGEGRALGSSPPPREARQVEIPGQSPLLQDGLFDWWVNAVKEDFERVDRPGLLKLWEEPVPNERVWDVFESTARTLREAQTAYGRLLDEHILHTIRQHMTPPTAAESECKQLTQRFRRELHATIIHSMPLNRVHAALGSLLYSASVQLFRLDQNNHQPAMAQAAQAAQAASALHHRLFTLLHALQTVGLGGTRAQRAFALAVDKLIDAFISSGFVKVDWFGRKSVMPKVRQWVKDGLAPFVGEILRVLGSEGVREEEIRRWQEMCVSRLGRARVESLFDFVVEWDGSLGAILDLKEYITGPAARAHLTTSFAQQLQRRLLHAGATTTHILDVYIYVIRSFNELDPKGVLLERVARPIRRYLRDRDDTARIIVASLLADVEDQNKKDANTVEISPEISKEMQNPIMTNAQDIDVDLDWGNMDWTPDPIDAGPEYKKSKSEDVIAYLLSLYDREEFITELKNILGDHLLNDRDSDFEKETMLLELFKLRLGDDKMQACEVMLRDVQASIHINTEITQMPHYKRLQQQQQTPGRLTRQSPLKSSPAPQVFPQLSAQILSSFFWPSLREEQFALPEPVQQVQKEYEKGFEAVKDMRKLHWLPALGNAEVVLEFEDRTVETTCLPWQASVIYAFQAENEQDGETLQLTAEDLEEKLEMDEALVKNGLAFWVSKLVLRPVEPGSLTYMVIDRLAERTTKQAQQAAAEAADMAAPAPAAIKSQQDVLLEKEMLYSTFINGILTNQGAMPAMRIHMMLRMAMQGGFPFGVEEVRTLLERMEKADKVRKGAGDIWAVKK